MKERFLPKQTVAVLGVAAGIALGSLYLKNHEQGDTFGKLYGDLAVIGNDNRFRVAEQDGGSYEVKGTFNGLVKRQDYYVVGSMFNDMCVVHIFRNGEVTTLADKHLSPHRVFSVNDSRIDYYTLDDYSMTFKTYDRQLGVTSTNNVMYFPSYYQLRNGERKPCE